MHLRDINDPRLVKALAHPLRIEILRALQDRVASPSDLAGEIGVRLPNISYHVRVLERIGVIELTKTRQRRGAIEHYYRARGKLRITDKVWAQVPDVVKIAMADSAAAQAVKSISTAASSSGFARKEALVSRFEVTLDQQGFQELSAAANDLVARLTEIQEESADRLASDDSAQQIRTGFVMTLFEAAAESSAEDEHSPPQTRAARAAAR